ncbi:MAG: hypothetical protein FD137_1250, partial [Spirochaetes bacterium]
MKKLMIIALAALLMAFGLAYSESYAKNGMLIAPGSLNANIGLGLRYVTGFGFGGGVEYGIGKFVIAEKLPFTYGMAGRAGLGLTSSVSFSAGVFGTLHFAWGALKFPAELAWLSNFDSNIGLGVTVFPTVDFDSIGGISYYLSNSV